MDDNVQLGPGRSSWNKGSTLGVAKEQQLLMPSNRYSLLSGSSEEPSSRGFGSSSREQEKYPGRQSGFSSLLADRLDSDNDINNNSIYLKDIALSTSVFICIFY